MTNFTRVWFVETLPAFKFNMNLAAFCSQDCSIETCFIFYLQASIAKLETSVGVFGDKLELKIYGFNDKLQVLLSKLLATAKSFLPTNDRFEVYAVFCCITFS